MPSPRAKKLLAATGAAALAASLAGNVALHRALQRKQGQAGKLAAAMLDQQRAFDVKQRQLEAKATSAQDELAERTIEHNQASWGDLLSRSGEHAQIADDLLRRLRAKKSLRPTEVFSIGAGYGRFKDFADRFVDSTAGFIDMEDERRGFFEKRADLEALLQRRGFKPPKIERAPPREQRRQFPRVHPKRTGERRPA